MSAPILTLAALRDLDPCRGAMERLTLPDGPLTARDAVEAGATLNDLVWVASAVARSDRDVERRLRLWMADCAARVLHVYERENPDDDRVRNAIVAARKYARGEITAAARTAAQDAAKDGAWAAEEGWQLDRLVAWLSKNEPGDLPLPASMEAMQ